jgi:hypothetical protein
MYYTAQPASNSDLNRRKKAGTTRISGTEPGKPDHKQVTGKTDLIRLLFYKRICDVWEEEYRDRMTEFNNDELARDPEEHRFNIPDGHFWKDVRTRTTNIGEHLNAAFHAIEDANLRLKGIFQDVDFNNKERFPDATLELLIQHFDHHRLRRSDVEPDMLGNEYVVAHEVCHLKHRNHSRKFWALLDDIFKDWKFCKTWLEKNEYLWDMRV